MNESRGGPRGRRSPRRPPGRSDMRKAMGLALPAAAALAGCKGLGFHESQDHDFSANVTAAGTTLEAAGVRAA